METFNLNRAGRRKGDKILAKLERESLKKKPKETSTWENLKNLFKFKK